MTAPDARQSDEKWRIGTSWGIHVYQGEKGSPGERPVATFHDPADAQRAVDAVNGRADVRPSDELREVLEQHAIPGGYRDLDRDELAAAILPVVTAWAETQARARAAEELRAIVLDAQIVGEVMHERGPIRVPVTYLTERADALTGERAAVADLRARVLALAEELEGDREDYEHYQTRLLIDHITARLRALTAGDPA